MGTRNRTSWLFGAVLPLLGLGACSDPETARRLQADIATADARIAEARVDMTQYGEGSALQVLVALRLHTHEQTRAMLEQKKAAAWYMPRLSYTVDGRAYEPPADLQTRLGELDARLQVSRAEADAASAKAAGTGGLIGALAAMEVETKRLLVSQLEYQLTAYRSGFPPYIAPSFVEDAGQPARSAGSGSVEPVPIDAVPSVAQQEREALQEAVGVRLASKTYVPSDARAGRYEDYVALDFEYANKTEKDIRAFTGTVVFKDIFERSFLRVNLTVDQPISAGQTLRDSDKTLKTNQFSDEHQKLITTQPENLRLSFEVESVLFADGTKLGSLSP